MKKLILLSTLILSIKSYSQIDDYRTDLEKKVYETSKLSIENGLEYNYYSKEEYELIIQKERKIFKSLGKPNKNSEISLFLKKYITEKDLSKINYSNIMSSFSYEVNPHKIEFFDFKIRLKFKLSEKNKISGIRIQTGNKELDYKIIKLFEKYPLKEVLKINDSKGEYSLQLFEKEGRKTIINASTFFVNDEEPTLEKCKNIERAHKRGSCWYKELYQHILNNISQKEFAKQKLRGEIKIYPRFSIDSVGNIYNVNSVAPNKIIKNEIDRVIETFNKGIIPAKRNKIPKNYFYHTNYILIIE